MANDEERPALEIKNNSLRRFAQLVKPRNNQPQMEIKTWFIQLLHSNSFIGMDHEDRVNQMDETRQVNLADWLAETKTDNFNVLFYNFVSIKKHVVIKQIKSAQKILL